jgi:hypothetical protein
MMARVTTITAIAIARLRTGDRDYFLGCLCVATVLRFRIMHASLRIAHNRCGATNHREVLRTR